MASNCFNMNSTEHWNPDIMEDSEGRVSTSFSNSHMIYISTPNQAEQSQNSQSYTTWFGSGSMMHSQRANQPTFSQEANLIPSGFDDMEIEFLLSDEQHSQPTNHQQFNHAFHSQAGRSIFLPVGLGEVIWLSQWRQLGQVGPSMADQSCSSMDRVTISQLHGPFLESTGGGVLISQQPLNDQVGPSMADQSYSSMDRLTISQQHGPFLESRGVGVSISQQPLNDQVGPSMADQFHSSMDRVTISQQYGPFLESTGGGVSISQQPLNDQVGPSMADQSYSSMDRVTISQQHGPFLESTGGGVSISQQPLNEAGRSQTDTGRRMRFQETRHQREPSSSARYSRSYRKNQQTIREVCAEIFEKIERREDIPADEYKDKIPDAVRKSKIWRSNRPSSSSVQALASFPRQPLNEASRSQTDTGRRMRFQETRHQREPSNSARYSRSYRKNQQTIREVCAEIFEKIERREDIPADEYKDKIPDAFRKSKFWRSNRPSSSSVQALASFPRDHLGTDSREVGQDRHVTYSREVGHLVQAIERKFGDRVSTLVKELQAEMNLLMENLLRSNTVFTTEVTDNDHDQDG